ncbi:hypothetical protein E2C01_049065 [Portunus trituberculatus]|uniref:Uncharacterized protein n=1 Tax=Portunus trituberculatus TaxID=210409 RepID=A0A5B7GCN8_PORTR|nr:hypothetical protein [Portunus trituberculatus]
MRRRRLRNWEEEEEDISTLTKKRPLDTQRKTQTHSSTTGHHRYQDRINTTLKASTHTTSPSCKYRQPLVNDSLAQTCHQDGTGRDGTGQEGDGGEGLCTENKLVRLGRR